MNPRDLGTNAPVTIHRCSPAGCLCCFIHVPFWPCSSPLVVGHFVVVCSPVNSCLVVSARPCDCLHLSLVCSARSPLCLPCSISSTCLPALFYQFYLYLSSVFVWLGSRHSRDRVPVAGYRLVRSSVLRFVLFSSVPFRFWFNDLTSRRCLRFGSFSPHLPLYRSGTNMIFCSPSTFSRNTKVLSVQKSDRFRKLSSVGFPAEVIRGPPRPYTVEAEALAISSVICSPPFARSNSHPIRQSVGERLWNRRCFYLSLSGRQHKCVPSLESCVCCVLSGQKQKEPKPAQ